MISILEQRTSKSRLTSLVSNLVVTPARLPSWQSEVQRSCLNNGWLWSRASSGLLIPCKHKSILKVEHLKVRTPRWPSHKYDPHQDTTPQTTCRGHWRCRGRHDIMQCSPYRGVAKISVKMTQVLAKITYLHVLCCYLSVHCHNLVLLGSPCCYT